MTRWRGRSPSSPGSAGGIGGAVAEAFAGAGATVVGLDRERGGSDPVADEVESFFAGLERVDILFNGVGISGRSLGDGPVDECTVEAPGTPSSRPTSRASSSARSTRSRSAGGGRRGDRQPHLDPRPRRRRLRLRHPRLRSEQGRDRRADARDGRAYAREGIRCQRDRAWTDRDADEPARTGDPGIRARLPELHPLTGDFGRPEDVAGAALYLATAPFVTGTVLMVDGGWSVR